jgi:preprotein translocase subunit SecE
MVNKIKLLVAALLLVSGLVGYYLLQDAALVVRIIAVLVGIAASVAVLWTTPAGRDAIGFVGESVAESKRVVWPTRKETIQTTMVVFVLVVVMAAFLALVDVGFAFMVQWLMGRSA